MKRIYSLLIYIVFINTFPALATTYTWTGNTSTAWNTTSNWSPSGTPTTGDFVHIYSATYNPQLTGNLTLNGIYIHSGTLNLNGDTLLLNSGTSTFSGGTISNGLLQLRGTEITFNSTTFNAPIDAVVDRINLNGCTFNNYCYFETISNVPGTGSGGAVFNDSVYLYHNYTGSGIWVMNNNTGHRFNGKVTIHNKGTKEITFTGAGINVFNGDIVLINTGAGGIMLGNDTLTAGHTISIGSGGFSAGDFNATNFYQDGNTAISLTFTGTALPSITGATFGGNFSITSNVLLFKNCTFSGTASFTATGSGSSSWYGGNTFYGNATFTNNATAGNLRIDADTANTYYADATFNGSRELRVCYGGEVSSFYGNITTANNTTFNAGTGTLCLAGSGTQALSFHSNTLVKNLMLNKSGGSAALSTALVVSGTVTFTKGTLTTTSSNLLTINNGGTVSGASDSSFIDGPVKKIGNSAFVFPTGKGNSYRAVEISAPSNTTDAYKAEFFYDSISVNTSNIDTTLGYVTRNRYWKLNRTNGSSNVYVSLYWGGSYAVHDTAKTYISGWNGTKWLNLGKVIYGNNNSGKVTSSGTVTSYSEFALAISSTNPMLCASTPQIIFPKEYFTFDVVSGSGYDYNQSSDPLTPSIASTSSSFALPSITSANIGTLSGTTQNYLKNESSAASSLTCSNPVDLTKGVICVEMLVKLDANFVNQRGLRFFNFKDNSGDNAFYGGIGYPYLYLNAKVIDNISDPNNPIQIEKRLQIPLDGVDRKSIDYYNDQGWHHFVFKINTHNNENPPSTAPGRLEIWVDGELNDFYLDDADLNNSLSILQPEFRLLDAGIDCFLGKMDNIAIYDDDVCPEQLYNNYKTCFPLLTNLEPVANYCYDNTNCDLSLITSIPTTPLTGAMNPNDFPENYTINTAPLSDGDLIDYINSTCSCNSSDPNWFVELDDFLQNSYDAQFTGVALPLDQLKSYPLPRYFPGHSFRQNVNFMGVNYLGYSGYPRSGGSYSISANAPTYSTDIQKELSENWNYSFVVCENSSTYPNTFTQAWINAANSYPADSPVKFAITTNRNHLPNSKVKKQDFVPDEDYYLMSYDWNPTPPTLSPNQFLDSDGNIVSSPKILKPLNDPTYLSNFLPDGFDQNVIFSSIFGSLTKNVSYVIENNEYTPQFSYNSSGIPAVANTINGDYTLSQGCSTCATPDDWKSYLGEFKKTLDNDYRDQFFGGTNFPQLADAVYLNYAVDGFDKYNKNYRFEYTNMRETQSQVMYGGSSQYLSTPDFYPRRAANWLTTVSADHGIDWVNKCRTNEIDNFSDYRYAPFVAAGWEQQEEFNIRPAQWLSLVKAAGIMGVDFYNTGYFNLNAFWFANPSGYVWQAVIPSYAQAVFSHAEDYFTNGTLSKGNVLLEVTDASFGYGYRFAGSLPNDLIMIRKINNEDKILITGSLQPLSNISGNVPDDRDIVINDLPFSSTTSAKINFRRQGSTYIFDNTNPGDPVFYQLDKWHEYKHPERWSKDFDFEAEVFDNKNVNVVIKTVDATSNSSITNGDFTNYTSYITFAATPDNTGVQYNFTPRADGVNNDYDIWVRARSRSGTRTGFTITTTSVGNSNFTQDNKVSCVSSGSWEWYKLDDCTGSAMTLSSLTDDQQYVLTLLPMSDDLEIDRILLDVDNNAGFTAASACGYDKDIPDNTSSTTVSISNNNFVNIQGTYIVNSNLSLTGCIINVEAGGEIDVQSGGTFSCDNCHISACGDMWNGINNTGGTVTLTSSTVNDALAAVKSVSGNAVDVTGCVFDHNYTAIWLENGSYSASDIYGNTFENTGGQINKAPHAGDDPLHHIYLNNVSAVTVGDASQAVNTFHNALNGIYAEASNLNVYNNIFNNIGGNNYQNRAIVPPVPPISIPNAAINARGVKAGYKTLNVGGASTGQSNTFNQCEIGVSGYMQLNADIRNNAFAECYTGIALSSIGGSGNTVNIEDNTIDKYNKGISLSNVWMNNSTVIKDNDLNLGAGYDAAHYGAMGIEVSNFITRQVKLTIENNHIENAQNGIQVSNVGYTISPVGYAPYADVKDNTVLFAIPVGLTANHVGLWLENMAYGTVENNTVHWTETPSGAGSELMQGLRLSNSVHCGITGNAIENMESGIMVFGNCSQTNLYCNKFESCFNSTYFSNNNSSNQLTDQGLKVETMGTYDPTLSEGWKNHWVSPVSDKAAGVLLAPNIFNWMYKPSVSFDYDPGNFTGYFTTLSADNETGSCTPAFTTDEGLRDQAFGSLVYDSVIAHTDSSEIKYLMEEVFYKLMRSDTSWLHLHVPSDSVYIDRYNAGKSGNAGNFATVQDSIASQNYSSASGILTGITSSLEQDLDKKFVLDCYLKYIADTLTLDSATFENLNKVAVQHPLYGGEGVYSARAMLNLDIIDILPGEEESRMANTASPPENKFIDQQDGKLYPSPTKGRVIFEMSSAFGASAKLDIYNSYGSLAASYPLNPNARSAEFNLSGLKPGVYSCRLYDSINLKMINKLVIIR